MTKKLKQKLLKVFDKKLISEAFGEITLTVNSEDIIATLGKLKNDFKFEILIDLCAVDYLTFGESDWDGNASSSGYGRGRVSQKSNKQKKNRFAVVYHLLSISENQRLRVKAILNDNKQIIESVINIWNSANWYEREAFDMFGILFENHDDLRRILTDYGFIGHPLRKDFPMIGEVEMRYDEKLKRVMYEPVSIKPNINVPKVIRK